MTPKGTLLLIGGAEDLGEKKEKIEKNKESVRFEILRELLPKSKKRRIEIITTATTLPERVKRIYNAAFKRIGYLNPGFIPIQSKVEATEKAYLKRIEDAAAVFFTGGDQFRIATILGGTKIVKVIKERYKHDKDFLVAGTSAGAMVMSPVMIIEGGMEEVLIDTDIKTSSGFSIIENCIIDTHFIKRGRFSRLAHAVILNPDQLGVGLGEDTALIIKNGRDAECHGSGMVMIIDGRSIKQTNMSDAKGSEPIYVENLIVHLLVKGCRFSLKTRKLKEPVCFKNKCNQE